MNITIKAVGQHLSIVHIPRELIEGSYNFVNMEFLLSSDWDGMGVTAQFKQGTNAYDVVLDNDGCAYLPNEIGNGKCSVLIYGSKIDDGDTVRRAVSDSVVFAVRRNEYSGAVQGVSSPTPTLSDQVLDALGKIKGDKGDPGEAGHSPVITAARSGNEVTIYSDGEALVTLNDGRDAVTPTVTVARHPNNNGVLISSSSGSSTFLHDGNDGTTPQRGVDYWTAEDIAQIKAYVDEAILGGSW